MSSDIRYAIWVETWGETIKLGHKFKAREEAEAFADANICKRCNRVEYVVIKDDYEWVDKHVGFVPGGRHSIDTVIPDEPRYCKYCYGYHKLECGIDGSLIVCSRCNAGLAPMDRAIEAGGYDAFIEKITREFEERHSSRKKLGEAQ